MPTTTIDDMDMYFEEHGEGAPLLLLHGFFGSSADWVHLFDLEALGREHRVIAPDLRGHGRSNDPGGAFSHRQCATDVLALLDVLRIDRVLAVGVSLGGNVLLHVATRAPERVEAMVLNGAASYFPAQARAIMRTVDPESRTEQEWTGMRAKHRLGDEQIRSLWRTAQGFADSHDDMCFTPPSLARITARTLIVTGDRDPLYPVEMFVEQYRAIEHASLCVLPDAGHDAIFGPARPFFERTALAFLRGGGDRAEPRRHS